jgi:hypothetical protein
MEKYFKTLIKVLNVPDMETGHCLDPGENGTGLEGGMGAGPAHVRGGKIGS